MNHLGDANKMVSDTPRTDDAYFRKSATMYDMAGEMKRMERELNAANQRIKRLEDALEGTVKWIVQLADSGDAGFWYVDDQPEIIAAKAALKKEDK